MRFRTLHVSSLLLAIALPARVAPGEEPDAARVRFNRDVRPILSENCFKCHGPDDRARQADLRLHVRDGAIAPRRRGAAVVPGDPARSLLVRRIRNADPAEVMPPPETNKTLTGDQIETLERWIAEGAEYEGHWAFLPPRRPRVPGVSGTTWVRNPIDAFVLARLESRGIHPSPEADGGTLARRVAQDITGLPPSSEEVSALRVDDRPHAYESLVEHLLFSPHFGERMAIHWLDLVRYADSVGYHGDQEYSVFPYRDWIIRAFNEGMPFDRFTVEQLGGDLLPGAARDQKVASGYNRLNMITTEGGAQDREYRAKYAADRVRTTAAIWLGATMGCAECHDHKFDPFTMEDFYSLAAFFADLEEFGFYPRGYSHGEWGPAIRVPGEEDAAELDRLDAELAAARRAAETMTPALEAALVEWEDATEAAARPRLGPWHAVGPFRAESGEKAFAKAFPPEREVDLAAAYDGGLRWAERADWTDGAVHELSGENAATYLFRTITVESPQALEVSLGSDDAIKVWLDGEEVLSNLVFRGVAPDQERVTLDLREGENGLLVKVVNGAGGYGFYFRAGAAVPEKVRAILAVPRADRGESQRVELRSYFLSVTPLLADARSRVAALAKEREELLASVPTTLVSKATEPRPVRILRRGNWMDDSGRLVAPAVPRSLGRVERQGRATRVDLGRWFVSPENPLAARAFVNRLWALFFGTGLSKVLDDLGSQGEWPTHPELLDWLAVEFIESGWDVRHIVRLIVTSSTYRQSSRGREDLRKVDPYNRLLARQSRLRLPAESVRDAALAVSGLLVRTIGGPSVRPYQPPGYWGQLNFPRREYAADTGASLYRRGLYTHWQRTFLHPMLVAFDAANRQECAAERPRSNTPLQALVLLNDPSFVEAARAFAERILREGGGTDEERLGFAYREALCREPEPREREVVGGILEASRTEFAAEPEKARRFLSVGERPVPGDLGAVELAAWTAVARAVLNVNEFITRY